MLSEPTDTDPSGAELTWGPYLVLSPAPPLTVASSCGTLCGVVSDFEAAHAELLAATGALGELLRRYGEMHWAEWVIRDRQRIQDGEAYGAEHLLSAYGGMGSLNDVVIDPRNGHRIAEEDISAANERLRQLSSRTYTAAMRLKVELRRSLCLCRGKRWLRGERQ